MPLSRKLLLAVLSLVATVTTAFAQAYPTRSITIVVPLAAGSGMDSIVRIYAEELAATFGKPVLIENQPGAALTLAAQNVAKAEPDGHTLLVSATTVMTANQTLLKKLNYDPDRDFVPISIYVDSPFVLIVSPGLAVDNMKAFAELAKSRSATPVSYATTGTGSLPHLTMEALRADIGFAASHVPYRNSGQIVTDVLGGHLDAALSETGLAVPLIREGKLKAMGVSARSRLPQIPDVPPLAESIPKPGYESLAWHILAAPAATPKPIVDRLIAEMKRITSSETFKQKVITIGLIPRQPATLEEMQAYIRSERERWGGIIKKLGLEGSQ